MSLSPRTARHEPSAPTTNDDSRRRDRALLLAVLSSAAVIAAMAVLAHVAFNELTTAVAVTVLLGSWCLFCTVVLATMRPLTVSLLTAVPVAMVIAANHLKYAYLREMLQFIDAQLLMGWIARDTGFLVAYRHVLSWAVAGVIAFAVLLVLAWRFETACNTSGYRIKRGALILVYTTGVAFTLTFLGSYYFSTVRRIGYYTQSTANTGIRWSFVAESWSRLERIRGDLQATPPDDAGEARPGGTDCKDCPDIIVYHAESVFDPRMLEAFADQPPLWTHFGAALASRNGFLRTNVFGGYSMVSEFEIMCGVNHQVFGVAGSYPNLYMQPFINNCGPKLLRDAGYDTIALYSTPAAINHAGGMFAAYGIREFQDSAALGLPPQWHLMRDKFLVDAALEILARPRTRPRFIWVSTMYNHGPHSASRIETRFPGPYDIDRVADGPTKDYLNRLNDSLPQMKRLEEAVAKLPWRTAVLYYGDHQPNVPVTYTAETKAEHGAAARFITFYRWATNWGVPGTSTVGPTLRIEHLMGEFLSHTGVSDLNPLRRIKTLADAKCRGVQTECDEENRRKLRWLVQH